MEEDRSEMISNISQWPGPNAPTHIIEEPVVRIGRKIFADPNPFIIVL